MEAAILADELQFARDSIFFLLREKTSNRISNDELLMLFMHIHKYYTNASDVQQIKDENMTQNEKGVVSKFLDILDDRQLITHCGNHEPADIFYGLVSFRCEIISQFSKLVSNFDLKSYIVILLVKETMFHKKFLPYCIASKTNVIYEYCLTD
ncbi:hypothetical protein PRIPAC_93051 [Pristionchus pacificus]|uniref:Uncharacterized protein n=1 Tax=Pristionchus pacificus TaxID=54126 RepID=A0A2A6BQF6_PRIPA|nr:hypothetical protein PRIPAC_93051 [Pristionchus pacificus]|eukprot:PDM68182.1 hypothetical protein PRIPAC_46226 [Pristionchus pacificus]